MRRWQSGQMQLAVNQSVLYLRGFKSLPAHKKIRPQADFDCDGRDLNRGGG